jgi:hypothetical protein
VIPKPNDDPKLEAHFALIIAIVGAVTYLRWPLEGFPSYGWLVIALPAAAWFIYRAKRNWRR